MREIRTYGSEGGGQPEMVPPYPYHVNIALGLGRMCPGMPIPDGKAWGAMLHGSKTHRRVHC